MGIKQEPKIILLTDTQQKRLKEGQIYLLTPFAGMAHHGREGTAAGERCRSHCIHSQRAERWVLVLGFQHPPYSITEARPGNGAAHIRDLFSLLGSPFLQTSSETHLEVCFHGDSKLRSYNEDYPSQLCHVLLELASEVSSISPLRLFETLVSSQVLLSVLSPVRSVCAVCLSFTHHTSRLDWVLLPGTINTDFP